MIQRIYFSFNIFIILVVLLTSCIKKVTIIFIQKTFDIDLSYKYGEEERYVCIDDEISITVLEFDKNHFLSEEEISKLKCNRDIINTDHISIEQGYIWVSNFMLEYNKELVICYNPLIPRKLTKDLNVYFGCQ